MLIATRSLRPLGRNQGLNNSQDQSSMATRLATITQTCVVRRSYREIDAQTLSFSLHRAGSGRFGAMYVLAYFLFPIHQEIGISAGFLVREARPAHVEGIVRRNITSAALAAVYVRMFCND